MDNHKEVFLVNKRSLKIEKFLLNSGNKDLFDFLELENYVCQDYVSAVKLQNNLDVSVRLN